MEQSNQQRANVLHLARRQPDKTIVQYVDELRSAAASGAVVGIMIAVHYGGGEFGYMGAGTLTETPTLGLGATLRLAQKLL